MATTYSTREQALAGLTKQKDEARIALNKAIKEKGITDSRDIVKLPEFKKMEAIDSQLRGVGTVGEIGTGLMSSVIGGVTGIPDLVSPGLNWAKNKLFSTGSQYPDIPQLYPMAMEAAGVPSEPTSEQAKIAFYGPDVALGAYGIASLLKSGFKGARNMWKDRKVQAFTSSLPKDEANIFKEYMLKGQGSTDPRMAAILQKLSSNPEYAEIFSNLQAGATKAATAGMTPAASRIDEPTAAKGIYGAVQNAVDNAGLKEREAASRAFNKAFEYGGSDRIIDPVSLRAEIARLKADFSKKASPSSEAALSFLQRFEEGLIPSITIPSRAGATVATPATAANTLMNIPGEAATSLRIPGGAGYTTKLPERKLTVQEVQSLLSEFGKKASTGDNILKDVSLTDEKRISSAIFGTLKDDLQAARLGAQTKDEIAATDLLIKARDFASEAADLSSTARAKGLPKFLQEKSIKEVDFDELYGKYKKMNEYERAATRTLINATEPEALKNLDGRVYQDFVDAAKTQLPDGTFNVSLSAMVDNWNALQKSDKSGASALLLSVGQNADEFSKRMKDAAIFTKRMSVGQPVAESLAGVETVGRDLARTGGAVAGGTVYQSLQLAKDAVKALAKTGLNDEETMRLLLTPEGSSFLKNAAMSLASTKTLEALTAVKAAELPATFKSPYMVAAAAGAVNKAMGVEQPMPEIPEGAFPDIPEGVFEAQPTESVIPEGMPDIPEGVFGAPSAAFSQAGANVDRRAILNSELTKVQQSLQATQNPDEQARAQADIDSLTREIGRLPR